MLRFIGSMTAVACVLVAGNAHAQTADAKGGNLDEGESAKPATASGTEATETSETTGSAHKPETEAGPSAGQPSPDAPGNAPAGAERPAPNSIFAEGLGAGLAYSFNYERRVIDDLAVRVGFSYLSVGASVTTSSGTSSSSSTFLTFPITASYLGVRGGKHALELGGGATLTYASASANALGVNSSGSGVSAIGTAMVGYRLHPVGGAGFQFRIGAMALVGKGLSLSSDDPSTVGVIPWGYLSLGASF